MEQLYRALGAAGGEPFETSGVYTPSADVRFPVLAQPNARARDSRTEVAPPLPPTGDFDDERPIVRKAAGLKLGGVVIAVAIVSALAVLALRPSAKTAVTMTTPAPATPPPAPVEKAAVGAPASPPAAAAEKPPAPTAAPEAKPAPRAEPSAHASHGKSHRSSAEVVRDIASKAGVEPAPAEKPAPTTPAELKNPFGNP